MSNNTVNLTVEEFSCYIQNKRDFYDAMVLNGYYLFKFKSSMITEDYMRDIQVS